MADQKEALGMTITAVRRDLFALVNDLDKQSIAIIRDGKLVAMLISPMDNILVRFKSD